MAIDPTIALGTVNRPAAQAQFDVHYVCDLSMTVVCDAVAQHT
jgi:hypothetical protein